MTTIRDLVGRLDELTADEDRYEVGPAIFARTPWTPDSDAVVLHEEAVEPRDAPGFRLVLEAAIASEVVRVWSAWRDGRRPNPDEAATAVIHYAMNDAYLPVTDGGQVPIHADVEIRRSARSMREPERDSPRPPRVPRWQVERDRLHTETSPVPLWVYRQWWLYAAAAVGLLGVGLSLLGDGVPAEDYALPLIAGTLSGVFAVMAYRHRTR